MITVLPKKENNPEMEYVSIRDADTNLVICGFYINSGAVLNFSHVTSFGGKNRFTLDSHIIDATGTNIIVVKDNR